MSEIAVRVESLSKRYRIGKAQRHDTLRDALAHGPRDWFRRNGHGSSELFWALKDVSFEVQRGEVVGIIGRNGAGKSTLLKILSRITEPTSGYAEIHGRVGSLLEVGTGFHPELTGRENIYLNGAILGMKRAEIARRFDEIVAFSEIEKFMETPVKHYSSGMYVRLAFAVAAHLEPEILIVDEVLAVGDAAFQKKCLGKIGDVAQDGRTVLFVSHNMAAVLSLCQQAFMLKRGTLSKSGRAEAVINEYVGEDVSAPGMVLIPADKGTVSNDFRFRSIRVLNAAPGSASTIVLNEGLELEIAYELKRDITGFNVAFHLWNSQGVCVLSSTDVDANPSHIADARLPGFYVARCHIPKYCLRAGKYFVSLSASIPNVRVLSALPWVLMFDIVEVGSPELETGQGRQGVIAPVLSWATQHANLPIC